MDGWMDKDKDALFNVAYNVTDNISSRAILRHKNIFNRYLPALLYLPSTTPLYASVSKGAASTTFYTFVMVRPRDSNLRPPAPKADALSTELSRRWMDKWMDGLMDNWMDGWISGRSNDLSLILNSVGVLSTKYLTVDYLVSEWRVRPFRLICKFRLLSWKTKWTAAGN